MPSLRNINKREEASKPDTGKYGIEPFMGAPDYAGVVCCPVYAVIGVAWGIVRQIRKRKHQKENEKADTGFAVDHPVLQLMSKPESERDMTPDSRGAGGTSPPRTTHGFKGDPKNPQNVRLTGRTNLLPIKNLTPIGQRVLGCWHSD